MTPARARSRCRFWLACAFTTVLARVGFELTTGGAPAGPMFESLLYVANAVSVGAAMWHAGWLEGEVRGRLDGLREGRRRS